MPKWFVKIQQDEFEMKGSPAKRLVFMVIKSFTGNGSLPCSQSYRSIARRAGLDHVTVARCVQELIVDGWLESQGKITQLGGSITVLKVVNQLPLKSENSQPLSGESVTTLSPESGESVTTLSPESGESTTESGESTTESGESSVPDVPTTKVTKVTIRNGTLSKNKNSPLKKTDQDFLKKRNSTIKKIWGFYLEKAKTQEKLLPGRKVKITSRLKTFTPEQIEQAITNCFNDPFYKGNNDRNWRANADYVFKSDEIIDRLLNLPKPKVDYSEGIPIDEWMGSPNYTKPKTLEDVEREDQTRIRKVL